MKKRETDCRRPGVARGVLRGAFLWAKPIRGAGLAFAVVFDGDQLYVVVYERDSEVEKKRQGETRRGASVEAFRSHKREGGVGCA